MDFYEFVDKSKELKEKGDFKSFSKMFNELNDSDLYDIKETATALAVAAESIMKSHEMQDNFIFNYVGKVK